ncbi:MAG: hypothetical protein U5N58_09380 [Actinomycetota bacterium]|nr:hypothetical protein [Actinomycetota bacterium]
MSTHQETVDLLIYMVKRGIQTLCFTTSRKMAELIAKWTKDKSKATGQQAWLQYSSYKAGYLPQPRRNIEPAIKEGRLKGIVSH